MLKSKCRNIAALLISFMFVFPLISQAATIDRIIVFGDSLSDNGNIYAITKKLNKVGHIVPVIPRNPPYYEGRFSNGPIWVEKLSEAMNVKLTDYAYGGAWVESLWQSGLLIPFSLGMQVNYYLFSEVADFHKDNHLYVIWGGANDYIQGRSNAEEATTKTVDTIKEQIDWLAYYGAKNFFIVSEPDVSYTPEVAAKGPEFVAQVKELVRLHNVKLAAMVAKQQTEHPNIKFVTGNIDIYFDDLFKDPSKYHLKNVKEACYGGYYYFNYGKRYANMAELDAAKKANLDIMNNPSLRVAYLNSKLAENGKEQICDEPDAYLFWDQIHPSRVIHGVIATVAQGALAANDIYGPAK